MDTRLASLLEILQLNTRLFLNCLADVDDETAAKRPGGEANSIAFIALHVLDARYYLASLVGHEQTNPYKELLDPVNSIDELTQIPPLAGVRDAWRTVSSSLSDRLATLTAAELDNRAAQTFPVDDESLLGGIAFLQQHESFHIGQIAYLRRLLGLGSMSY